MSKPHALIALLILLLAGPCNAAVMTGWVVWVVDGDTLHLMDKAGERHRIRLAGINAPEKGKAFSQGARDRLVSLAQGKEASVYWEKVDKYDRIVGKVVVDSRDINLAIIRAGYARWYRRFAHEQSQVDRMLYENAERTARQGRVGIWGGAR
ncbi:MAG: thermonuclease family protein [Gammaproteobacteria bacterium]|nr:thermonuclease family protein [Gammaproteobacteria bacterium]MBU1653417.1 thermonuclease family protein [Gammaproteobacteria bacterium]MBU1959722.1 thermonuclease family protein [Gammaproteobacteria bacterium]